MKELRVHYIYNHNQVEIRWENDITDDIVFATPVLTLSPKEAQALADGILRAVGHSAAHPIYERVLRNDR
jgi:hypothetical protein